MKKMYGGCAPLASVTCAVTVTIWLPLTSALLGVKSKAVS